MEKKVFLFGALVLGLMTSVGTGIQAQERGTDLSTSGKMEAFDKESLINQESTGTPARAVGEEESRSEQPAPEQMEAADESPAMHEMRTAGTGTGEEKSESFLTIHAFKNNLKNMCNNRPKTHESDPTLDAFNKACEAMGCSNNPYDGNCSVE